MTIQELIDKTNEVGMEAHIISKINFVRIGTVQLKYGSSKFGEIIWKNHNHHIHSHYWKKQDENIQKVSLDKFENALKDFIKRAKAKKIERRLNVLEEDFKDD